MNPSTAILALLGLFAVASQAADTPLALTPCQIQHPARVAVLNAQCGTLEVPENPQDPKGRKIGLRVAQVRAISQRKIADPLFLLAGGPGSAATDLYAQAAPVFARILRDRDIVLLDQRGTGQSNALLCELDEEELMRTSGAAVEAETKRCLDTLSTHADVAYYTTSVAVQDLDKVRAALGYARINLYGSSYGTRVAQHYLRKFPSHTRSVILDGVVAPDTALGPAIALDAERALTTSSSGVHAIRRVASISAIPLWRTRRCERCFWPSRSKWISRSHHRRTGRARVRTPASRDGAATGDLHIGRGGGAAPGARPRPSQRELHAARGAVPADVASCGDQLAYGMHNSVVCTEDVPFYRPGDINRGELASTFLGTTQLDALQNICKTWPRGPLDKDLREPVRLDTPVLLLVRRQ